MRKLNSFKEAEAFLYRQIPSFEKKKFPGQLGLSRTKYLMKLLGDPQEKLKIIHVAGTSGKGSTSFFTALLLESQGFKVGLTISPHLVDIRERIQINGTLVARRDFVDYLNNLLPAFYELEKTKYGPPTYFEIIQALSFLVFLKKKVDYAVIETGLGGTLDASNVVKNPRKVCIITKIGLDHTKILGKTVEEIAKQKAGIIQRGNFVFTLKQVRGAESVIQVVSKSQNASLNILEKTRNFSQVKEGSGGTKFNFAFGDVRFKDLNVSARGSYQAENLSLALAALTHLAKRDKFLLDESEIRKSLATAYFPGRFDVKKMGEKDLIIDGAHNPQKMRAFLDALNNIFPMKKYDFLIAFKKNKDYKKMLKQIQPFANKIYLTSFLANSDMKENISEKPEIIGAALHTAGFTNFEIEKRPKKALNLALFKASTLPVVVTGSLYLCGEIYKSLEKSVKTK